MAIELITCPDCGTRNGPHRTTCLSCSAPLASASEGKSPATVIPAKTNGVEELEKKTWFRFFKLCYIFVYVLAVAFVLFLVSFDLPKDYFDDWDSQIFCNNGKVYPTSGNSIYPHNGTLDQAGDAKAGKLCAGNIFDQFDQIAREKQSKGIPPERLVPPEDLPPDRYKLRTGTNYKLVTELKTRGSYKEVAKFLFWGLVIIWFLGEVVRRSFLYVAIGKKFFS